MKLKSLLRNIFDYFFPKRCVFCQNILLQDEKIVCEKCRKNLPWTSPNEKQIESEEKNKIFSYCVSPLYYKDDVKTSFHRYKFGSHWHYSDVYAHLMYECFKHCDDFSRYDFITWVPISFQRKCKRGYDQSKLLAEYVSKYSGVELKQTLIKHRHTKAQSTLMSVELRKTNVQNAYKLANKIDVRGKKILLIDDIKTTGSTLHSSASTLVNNGASEIVCLTFARSAYKSI